MVKYTDKEPQVLTFQSWGDAVAYARTTERTPGSGRSSDRSGDGEWSGNTRDLEHALAIAESGWKEGRERVQAMTQRLEIRMVNRIVRQEIMFETEGMDFELGRYLSGEPEFWFKPQDAQIADYQGTRHVKIVVNICASSGIPGACLEARGSAAAALVNLLEYADCRVELWTMDCRGEFAWECKIKSYDQPLDLDRVAFALAHPASLRRMGFKISETADASIAKSVGNHGYGVPRLRTHPDASITLAPAQLWNGDVQWQSPESVETWVLAQLAAQGVVLRDE